MRRRQPLSDRSSDGWFSTALATGAKWGSVQQSITECMHIWGSPVAVKNEREQIHTWHRHNCVMSLHKLSQRQVLNLCADLFTCGLQQCRTSDLQPILCETVPPTRLTSRTGGIILYRGREDLLILWRVLKHKVTAIQDDCLSWR